MSSQRSTKGKRVLPNIPMPGSGVKRSVTFNKEIIETSIGGTNTPGKIKGDPLSPINRLSYEEFPQRNLESDFSSCVDSAKTIKTKKMSNCDGGTNVSVEVKVSNESEGLESDKENDPDELKSDTLIVEQTLVRGIGVTNGYVNELDISEKSGNSAQFHSPNLPVRFRTPIRRHTMDEKLLGTPECFSVVQLDRQRYDFGLFDDELKDGEDSCSVTVAVRVRPFSQRYSR